MAVELIIEGALKLLTSAMKARKAAMEENRDNTIAEIAALKGERVQLDNDLDAAIAAAQAREAAGGE